MKIAVYGMGRFGTFWASLLSDRFEVAGYSRSSRQLPETIRPVEEKDLCRFDVVFLCCAISAVEEVLHRISPLIKPDAVVIDTCSVKVAPSELMLEILPVTAGIIATHPMFGPDSGKNGIEGLPLVFCPLRDVNNCFRFWFDTFRDMKLSVYQMTADEHDREAAFTQGITHFIGRVLKEIDLPESRIATLGYKKIREIIEQTCNDPLQLFIDLQKYNPHTGEMRTRLKRALDDTMKLF